MEAYTAEEVGQVAIFADPTGKRFPALITAVWGRDENDKPATVNIVIVSDNVDETDPYGRQIKRYTSVVCRERQAAHGMYFEMVAAGEPFPA